MEIQDILSRHDFALVYNTTQAIGPKLSRAEILTTLQENGAVLVDNTVFMVVGSQGSTFLVRYSVVTDKFATFNAEVV